jgi:murein DD-endopeptidase MepM/ murein hydrolase activator NlpD
LINGILAAEELLASRVAYTFRTYPKQITAMIAAALLSAGTLAVASLGPDASDLPVHQILEATTPVSFADQSQSLENFSFTLFRTDVTRSSDTAEALLKRLGISDPTATAFVRGNSEARNALFSRAGRTVTAEATQENQLKKHAPGQRHHPHLAVRRRRRLAHPDEVAIQVADIFSGEIDFHRGLRKGDRFSVVYEALEADGEPLRTGRVLSAEFVNNGKIAPGRCGSRSRAARAPTTRLDGKSLTSSYLASPMEFSRVTSSFKMRFHPILKQLAGRTWARLRRAPGHAGAHGRRRHRRIRRRAERLRQRGLHRHNGPTSRSMRTCRASTCAGQKVSQGQRHRRGRLHRLGHRPAPALRVPRQRRQQGSRGSRARSQGVTLTAAARPRSTAWPA